MFPYIYSVTSYVLSNPIFFYWIMLSPPTDSTFEWLYWNVTSRMWDYFSRQSSKTLRLHRRVALLLASADGRLTTLLASPALPLLLVFITPLLLFCCSNALFFLPVVHIPLLYSRLLIFICGEANVTAQNIFLRFHALISNEFANRITLRITLANSKPAVCRIWGFHRGGYEEFNFIFSVVEILTKHFHHLLMNPNHNA
jgi:hypothetical protein